MNGNLQLSLRLLECQKRLKVTALEIAENAKNGFAGYALIWLCTVPVKKKCVFQVSADR